MADVNAKVMKLVEDEIRKNPGVSNQELFEKAKGVDKSVGNLNARQFNARYPLQVKRAMAPKGKRGGRKKAAAKKAPGRKPAARKAKPRKAAGRKSAGRKAAKPAKAAKAAKAAKGGRRGRRAAAGGDGNARVRSILLELARDVADAKGGAVVDVVAGIDRYVDRVVKAAS